MGMTYGITVAVPRGMATHERDRLLAVIASAADTEGFYPVIIDVVPCGRSDVVLCAAGPGLVDISDEAFHAVENAVLAR